MNAERPSRVVAFLIRLGFVISGVAMSFVLAAGLLQVLSGGARLLPALRWWPTMLTWDAEASALAVSSILKGIEYMFLAPIIYLSFVSVCIYSRDRMSRIAALMRPSNSAKPPEAVLPYSMSSILHEVKSLFAGLMVAVLLTDLVARILYGRPPFEAMALLAHSVGIIMCGAYYVVLNRLGRSPN